MIEQQLNHVHTEGSAWEYDSSYHRHDCIANDGLGTGTVIAIIIAVIVVVIGGGFAIYWFVIRKKKES